MSSRKHRDEEPWEEPPALREAFAAVEQAQREADRGFRRVLELLNPKPQPDRDGIRGTSDVRACRGRSTR